MLRFFAFLCLLSLLAPASAWSQTWEPPDQRPVLREIVAVDASGEPRWPFGSEDIAQDSATWSTDEARLDIRSVYAAADANRFWLRAYFGAETTATFDTNVLFVFIDRDGNPATGTGADASDLFAEFTADPTQGGYEVVVGVQANGSVRGVWTWDNQRSRWQMQNDQPGEVNVESDLDVDPLRIGADTRAYLQVDVAHSLTGLNASCGANLFVRSFNDAATVAYGDLNAGGNAPCVARVDANGDPIILTQPTSGCTTNADCPGAGVCASNGTCLIGYECVSANDCATNETCTNNVCVRVVNTQCTSDAQCDRLVCDGGACVPCASGGARACGTGLECAPNGSCVAAANPPPPQQGDALDEVRGGACMCRLGPGESTSGAWFGAFFVALVLAWRRRSPRTTHEG